MSRDRCSVFVENGTNENKGKCQAREREGVRKCMSVGRDFQKAPVAVTCLIKRDEGAETCAKSDCDTKTPGNACKERVRCGKEMKRQN